jgi:hypothetical protein
MRAMTLRRLASLLLLPLALAGCGTPTQPAPMTLSAADALQLRGWVPDVFKAQVAVAPVQGGEETGRWWGSKVSAAALQRALEDSFYATGMKPPAPEPVPRFELQAEMLNLEQPLIAAGVTVTVTVRYTLTDKASGKIVYQRPLSASSEAGFTEAMLSQPERTRLANERALRLNITMLLRDLVVLRP